MYTNVRDLMKNRSRLGSLYRCTRSKNRYKINVQEDGTLIGNTSEVDFTIHNNKLNENYIKKWDFPIVLQNVEQSSSIITMSATTTQRVHFWWLINKNQYVINRRNHFKTHRSSSCNNINDSAWKKSHLNKIYNLFLNYAYNGTLRKKALFLLPTEAVGKKSTEEMTKLVVVGRTNQTGFITTKPSLNSKTKENSEASKRSLHLWKNR